MMEPQSQISLEPKFLLDILENMSTAIVALNSDEWLVNKKKKVFMNLEERRNILINLESVDEVITFKDDKNGSCIDALKKIKDKYPNEEIIFCNGGDRNKDNIP